MLYVYDDIHFIAHIISGPLLTVAQLQDKFSEFLEDVEGVMGDSAGEEIEC